jgi:flagellar motor switch protein FliN
MENHKNKIAVRSFAAAFGSAVSEAMSKAIGSPWTLEAGEGQELPARTAQPVQFRMKVEGGLRGECFIEFYDPQLADLIAMIQPGEGSDAEKALAAVLASALPALSASLGPQFGDLEFKVEAVTGLAFGGMFVVALSAPSLRPGAAVFLYFDGELLDSLAPAPAVETRTDSGDRSVHPSNLKLVMDVELNVSLRFGQRQLPLRDVLELGSGSVVELDRLVDEPVELLLDGKLIARGEAVIVDGNYGLRVTEIPQNMESHFLR